MKHGLVGRDSLRKAEPKKVETHVTADGIWHCRMAAAEYGRGSIIRLPV